MGESFSHPAVQVGGQILVETSLNDVDSVLGRASIL
jgi:hypothetical protein